MPASTTKSAGGAQETAGSVRATSSSELCSTSCNVAFAVPSPTLVGIIALRSSHSINIGMIQYRIRYRTFQYRAHIDSEINQDKYDR